MNAMIKEESMLQFHAKLHKYSQRNVLALTENEVKSERVEPCVDAPSWCSGVHELKLSAL